MANLFQVSQPVFGLMGRRPQQQQGLLDPELANLLQQVQSLSAPQPMMADAGDERMAAQDQQRQLIESAPRNQPSRRPSLLNALGRSLAPNTAAAYDAERARILAEDNAPRQQAIAAENERIARALGPTALLALRTNSEALGGGLSEQFKPQVVAEGAAQRVAGTNDVFNNRRTREFGDSLVRDTDTGYETLGTRGPTIQEQTAQDRLAWDQQYGTSRLGIDQYQADTGRMNAETTAANAGFTASPGQVRFDPYGNPIASVAASPNASVSKIAQEVAGFEANNDRFRTILTTINGDPRQNIPPAFDLSPANALKYEFDLARGSDNPEAAAYGNYKSEIESAVSDALRLNTGPQTDQDAIREARALLSNINNRAYVSARLPTVIANNERLMQARRAGLPAQSAAPAAEAAPVAPTGISREAAIVEARRRGLIP